MLIVAVALKDSESVARLLYRVGVPDARANLAAFRNDIDGILGRHLPTHAGRGERAEPAARPAGPGGEVPDPGPEGVRHPLARVGGDGGHPPQLSPDLNISRSPLPYAKELLAGRYDIGRLQGGLLRTLLRLQGLAATCRCSSRRSSWISRPGSFSVHVRAEQLDQLNTSLRVGGGHRLPRAVRLRLHRRRLHQLLPGAVDGARASRCWACWGRPAAAALFGAAFTWYLFGGRFHKVRLTSFLKRTRPR